METETEILRVGHETLKAIAVPIDEFNERLITTVNKMFTLLKKYQGIGLAAPQMGLSKRIIVYGAENNARYPNIEDIPCKALINPVILDFSAEQDEFFEGCLSVPNIRGPVQRSIGITGYAQDLTGKIIPFKEEGLLARVIQHEVDHLDGIIFLQRVTEPSRIVYSVN